MSVLCVVVTLLYIFDVLCCCLPILGMRLENWFHYCIGVAAPFIAMAL